MLIHIKTKVGIKNGWNQIPKSLKEIWMFDSARFRECVNKSL